MNVYLSKSIRNIHYFGQCLIITLNDTNKQIIIKKEIEKFLIQKSLSGIDLNMLSELVIHKFEITDSKEEVFNELKKHMKEYSYIYSLEEKEYWKTPILTGKENCFYPNRVQIELTDRCNLDCPHCYKNANTNGIYILYDSLSVFLNFTKGSLYEIGLTGGEPLLHPQFNDVALLCSKNCKQLELNTNGLLLYKLPLDIIRLFRYISISLYGLDDNEYSDITHNKSGYSLLSRSCNYMKMNGVNFNISVILKKSTISEMEHYVLKAIFLGAVSVQFGTTNKIGRGSDIKDSADWYLTEIDNNYIFKEMRLLSRKYSDKIKVIEWTRENYKNDESDTFSGLYSNSCFECSAGTLQWGISENMIFKPCAIFPEEASKYLNFQKWKQYVNGESNFEWNKYLQDLKRYCKIKKQNVHSYCDRLIL